jgi:hypothetical protein
MNNATALWSLSFRSTNLLFVKISERLKMNKASTNCLVDLHQFPLTVESYESAAAAKLTSKQNISTSISCCNSKVAVPKQNGLAIYLVAGACLKLFPARLHSPHLLLPHVLILTPLLLPYLVVPASSSSGT